MGKIRKAFMKIVSKYISLLISLLSIALFITACVEKRDKAGDIKDLQAYISEKLSAGEKRVVIPAGVYKINPTKDSYLTFENLEGVYISAKNVELRAQCGKDTKSSRLMSLKNCKNLTIDGLVIDMEPIPFTQGKITKVADDNTWFEATVSKGYNPEIKGNSDIRYLQIFGKDRKLKCPLVATKDVVKISDGSYRFIKTDFYAKSAYRESVGDMFCASYRDTTGGVFSVDCKNTTFKNVTLYTSGGMAYYELRCDKTTFDTCVITRRDKDDYLQRETPRLRSSTADGYHSRYAPTGPQIINSVAEFMADDAVALECVYNLAVSSKADGSIRLLMRDASVPTINVGDEVEIFTPDGKVERAKAVSVSYDGNTMPEEIEIVKTLPFQYSFVKRMNHAMSLKLDSKKVYPRGTLITSLNSACRGFKIKGGRFGNVRSRGLLLKASDGVVDGVTVSDCWMSCVKMAPEHFWLEAPHSNNVEIKNSKIDGRFGIPIDIHSKQFDGKTLSKSGAHKNISIQKNTIIYNKEGASQIASVDGLKIRDNKIVQVENPRGTSAKQTAEIRPAFVISNCKNVDYSKDGNLVDKR